MQNRQDGSNPQYVSSLATKCVLIAGIGGTMPVLTRLAGELVAKGNSSMPDFGFFIGVALYFIAGAVVSFIYSEEKTNVRQEFVTGLAAPALISSMINGASVVSMEKSSN